MESTARQARVGLMKPEPIPPEEFKLLVDLIVAAHTPKELLDSFIESETGVFDLDKCVLWAAFDAYYPRKDPRPSTLYYDAYKKNLK